MRGQQSVYQETSEFRIEKMRTPATVVLSNGTNVRGAFFIAGSSATHDGPERVKDVLNGEPEFVPFEPSGEHAQTVIYNRDHILYVALSQNSEARLDPGYDVATRRKVRMLLSNGTRLSGYVSVYRPRGRDRLSDFARSPEHFRYLEADAATYLINVRHLVEMTEESPNQ